MGTTQLGKELKKLRIDLGMNLMEMSKSLNVSSAFLSAIETGRKRVPDNFLDLLAAKFSVVASNRKKFETLINQARNEVRMPLDNATFEDAALATALARRFGNLSQEEKMQISNILGSE